MQDRNGLETREGGHTYTFEGEELEDLMELSILHKCTDLYVCNADRDDSLPMSN